MSPPKPPVNKISPIALGNVLERDRLFALLHRESPINSFWISGPGGSGKTTLLASFLQNEKKPCLWYQVDTLDNDPATFFYYLGQAAVSLQSCADLKLPALTPEYLPHIDVFIMRYFDTLFQRTKPDTWFVFDNFQDVPDESILTRILALALKQAPQHVTIAIVSRNDPPDAMARFIANQTMRHIGWDILGFTSEEFNTFLGFLGYRIDLNEADRLYNLTQGWIAGIILWLQHQRDDILSQMQLVDQPPEYIFHYFAAEVFEKLDTDVKNFLLKTAYLPAMTEAMAHDLTGIAAKELLELLHRKNFFLQKRALPGKSYQFHPLFRTFLLGEAERIFDSITIRNLRSHAAEILEKQGQSEEAVELFAQAEAYAQIQAIILARAPELVGQGRYVPLSNWINYLPTKLVESDPYLLYWKAVSLTTTDLKESKVLCNRAYIQLIENKDIFGQILSWSTSIEIQMMLRGSFLETDYWISEGLRLGDLLSKHQDRNPHLLSYRLCWLSVATYKTD